MMDKITNDTYENIIKIINDVEKASDNGIDLSLIKSMKSIINKIKDISYKNELDIISMEIKKVSNFIKDDNDVTYHRELLQCLFKCRQILRELIIENNLVLIFTKAKEKFLLLEQLLHNNGFCIKYNHYEFINNTYENNYAVIIIDDMDSDFSVSLFKKTNNDHRQKSIAVIVLGEDNRETKLKFLSLGAVDYILPNFDSDELFYKINNIRNLIKDPSRNYFYDTSTGAYTEQCGVILAENQFETCKVNGTKLNFLLIELDNIPLINNEHEVKAGNLILSELVKFYSKYLNTTDFIFRFQRYSLGIIILNREPSEVLKLTENVRKEISYLQHKLDLEISFSGDISYNSKDTYNFNSLLTESSDNLNKAMKNSKNKVYIKSLERPLQSSFSILLVDDDQIILSILTSRYKNKGYSVYCTEDALKALELLKKKDVDIIVTDYYMPKMLGVEFIKEIRKFNKKVKIIVLSGQKGEELMKRSIEFGADDYISKPFSPMELDLRIKRFLKY